MKKTLFSLLALICCMTANSQDPKYVPQFKPLYSAADSTVSPSSAFRPLIGVFDSACIKTVADAGGAPVLLCPQGLGYDVCHDIAASLDGVVFSPVFIRNVESQIRSSSKNAPDALMLKAFVDLNVPSLGNFPLLDSLNTGLRRIGYPDIATVPELVSRAALFHRAKAVMDRCITVDTHCDLPGRYRRGYSVGRRTMSQISMQRMAEGHLDAEVLIAFAGGGPLTPEGYEKIHNSCFRMLQRSIADVAAYPEYCGIARTPAEALKLREDGKKVFFLAVENAYGLGHDIGNVRKFRDNGVIYMTLSHMYDNDVCNTSYVKRTSDPKKGLTEFGRKVVAELNACGVMVDVSHTSEGTFWDVYKYSKAPFICSHSGADAVYHHDRNLTDEQLRALAEKGGVIQVFIVDNYQNDDASKTSIREFYAHLKHCIEVAGIDHVGVGADFDGGGGGWGLNAANDMTTITMMLLADGYSETDIAKIWGGNFLRVMSEVQRLATK